MLVKDCTRQGISRSLTATTPDTQCGICGRTASRPYRRVVDGRITEGCVALVHEAYLPAPSNSLAWAVNGRKSLKGTQDLGCAYLAR
jgi:hypothetical protein